MNSNGEPDSRITQAMYWELKQELLTVKSDLTLEISKVKTIAKEGLTKSTENRTWLFKGIGTIVIFVLLAVLRETFGK